MDAGRSSAGAGSPRDKREAEHGGTRGYRPRENTPKRCLGCVSSGRTGGGAPRLLTVLDSSWTIGFLRRVSQVLETPGPAPAALSCELETSTLNRSGSSSYSVASTRRA